MKPSLTAIATALILGLLVSVRAATIDQNWESRFVHAPGLNGEVFAILGVGTNLFVAGAFGSAGVAGTGGVARWDGTKWSSVGGGINGAVFALATDGTNIFAGGGFTTAGGVAATNIAKWNGTNWASIGAVHMPDGLNPSLATVHTLVWDGTNLLAGGLFSQAGGVSATNVARWNGQSWSGLGNGLGVGFPFEIFRVYALAIHHNELFAAGLFHLSGETGVTNLARWTGSAWEQVGGGLRGGTAQIAWFDGILTGAGFALNSTASGLLVGGDFSEAGGILATNIALWDGTNWSAIGGVCDSTVYRVVTDGPDQLVLGSFSTIGGIAAAGIGRWNGVSWSALGQGVVSAGLASARVGTNLFVGGNFQVAGGQSAGHVARWHGTDWVALLPGECTAPSEFVGDLAFDPVGNLYVAGGFQTAGKVRAHGVARYNGTNWSALGNGFPERNVRNLALVGTNVYVDGYFVRPASGITNLARWDGTNWVALGSGLGNDGYAPNIYGFVGGATNLFVTGQFTTAGGMPATNLASWNGSQWSAIPLPLSTFCASTHAPIATLRDELFVCQQGSCIAGDPTQVQIKKWDGTQWADVGAPFALASVTGNYPALQSMICAGSNLFIAGHFAVTNGFFATNLVRWNGQEWTGVNHAFGADTSLSPLVHDGTNLFVAVNPFGVTAADVKLAKWDGANWKVLGTGVTSSPYGPQVGGLAVRGRDLFVGGSFSSAGGKPANHLALWHDFPEVQLSARGWQTNGHFGLRVHGGRNQLVQVQASTNLQSWSDLGLKLPDSDPFDFDQAVTSPAPRQSYRLLLVP